MLTRTARRTLEELEKSFSPTKSASSNATLSKVEMVKIALGTLNVRDGRGGNIEMACRELQKLEMDLVMVTETKFLNGQHTSLAFGYEIFATNCHNRNQGGVVILVRKHHLWHIEDVERWGTNVIKCTLVYGASRRTVVGVYIPPSEENMSMIQCLDEALTNVDLRTTIIMGDLNINYANPKDERSDRIAEALESLDLVNIRKCFKWKSSKPYTWTWRMYREGRRVQSICDYILSGRDVRWRNCKVVDTILDTDHRMIKGILQGNTDTRTYKRYMRERKRPDVELFGPPSSDSGKSVDLLLKQLHEAIPKQESPQRTYKSWITEESFKLLKSKHKAVQRKDSEETKRIGKELRRSIRRDRRARIDRVADQIEAQLECGDIIGAFGHLRHWYRKFTGRPLKPSTVKLDETKEVYEKLFTADDFTTSMPYDFDYDGDEVKDDIPTEDEIIKALYRMRNRKAPGMTGVSIDHIKQWYKDAYPQNDDGTKREGDADALKNWNTVVLLVQKCIEHGEIPDAFLFGILVIIPKDDKGGVRGIGLLEAIHKLISQIINIRMASAVSFDKDVHGFRKRRCTYTAIGERKLRMQMAVCSSTTVYQVYLDLMKAYDSIDRQRVLLILQKYKVGPNLRRYIAKVWEGQKYFLRQAGFYSEAVHVHRGCTQGDTNSPIIFNLIVDAVLRTWKQHQGFQQSQSCFYADDGLLEHTDSEKLQNDLDIIIELFGRVGLKANAEKTKYMVVRGAAAPRALTKEEYNKRLKSRSRAKFTDKTGQWRRQSVECLLCGKKMQQASLARHMQSVHTGTSGEKKYQCTPVDNNIKGKIFTITQGTNKFINCPVPDCTGGGRDKSTMYRHFNLRHPEADVIITEDGILPKCQLCGFRTKNMTKHENSPTCLQAQRRRGNEEKMIEQAKANQVKFTVNGKAIERVRKFKYLGRFFTDNDNDSVCIQENIKNARKRWNCIGKILKAEGASAKCMAKFYITIVQAVLLYGADSWITSKRDLERLRSFHHRAVRYITGRHIRKRGEDHWEYPHHEDLLKECKLFPIEVYIERRRGTLMNYFEENCEDLLGETKSVKKHPRDAHKLLWWNQKWIKKTDMRNMSNFWFDS